MLDMQKKATLWLDEHATNYNIIRNKTYASQICLEHGHHILLTPPYHPELQPIEKLWRNVKMWVARNFSGNRSMLDLWDHVRQAFSIYGTAYYCKKNVEDARVFEKLYSTPGASALSLRIDGNDVEEEASSDNDEHFSPCSDSECSDSESDDE